MTGQIAPVVTCAARGQPAPLGTPATLTTGNRYGWPAVQHWHCCCAPPPEPMWLPVGLGRAARLGWCGGAVALGPRWLVSNGMPARAAR
jgi:hypothetical protein